MVTVNHASRSSRPMGIRAPDPRTLYASGIKARQRVEIRPGESMNVFVERRIGVSTRLQGLNKNTPFTITRLSSAPAGVPIPRTPGDWYRISLKAGEKEGQVDQVKLVSREVAPGAKAVEKPFNLVSGSQRYY